MDLANRIRDAKDAKEAKSLSRCIQCISTWDAEHLDLMYDIVDAKFHQVEECQEKLLETGEKVIVEAVPTDRDKYWGSGMGKEATLHTDRNAWPGDNTMGEILMKVRQNLREELSAKKIEESDHFGDKVKQDECNDVLSEEKGVFSDAETETENEMEADVQSANSTSAPSNKKQEENPKPRRATAKSRARGVQNTNDNSRSPSIKRNQSTSPEIVHAKKLVKPAKFNPATAGKVS